MLAADINNAFQSLYQPRILRTFMTGTSTIGTNNAYHLSRNGAGPNYTYGFRQAGGGGPLHGGVPANQLAGDATIMNNLAVKNHGDVKLRADWRTLYHRAQRPLQFCRNSNTGVAAAHGNYWSYPCGYCGLVLPEELIQVDHRQPQQWPAVAIMKVMRTVGGGQYASAASTGQKAAQFANLAAGGVIAPITVGKHDFGQAFVQSFPTGGNAVEQRHTLTVQGEVFLTVCTMVWGENNVTNVCLNNVLNLVPACAQCNGGSGKSGFPYMHHH